MNLLLDTHILIWVFLSPAKLSKRMKAAVENPQNAIYVSVLSLWEISLKHSVDKLNLKGIEPEDFSGFIKKSGFHLLSVADKEAATYHLLTTTHHKDPFDRMMIWQAICNDFTFVTDDKNIKKYSSAGLKLL
jgi:PIN domain nuclease of toxin-antitoxin system